MTIPACQVCGLVRDELGRNVRQYGNGSRVLFSYAHESCIADEEAAFRRPYRISWYQVLIREA